MRFGFDVFLGPFDRPLGRPVVSEGNRLTLISRAALYFSLGYQVYWVGDPLAVYIVARNCCTLQKRGCGPPAPEAIFPCRSWSLADSHGITPLMIYNRFSRAAIAMVRSAVIPILDVFDRHFHGPLFCRISLEFPFFGVIKPGPRTMIFSLDVMPAVLDWHFVGL